MKSKSKNTPMASAPFVFGKDGEVLWDQMWTDFCLLAKEGGPPHRNTKLMKKDPTDTSSAQYRRAVDEVLRAYKMLVPYKATESNGWAEIKLYSSNMAKWFQNIIELENVECKVQSKCIYLPINDDFTLEKEIKNVVTVLAKAHHYWSNHRTLTTKFFIHVFGKDIQDY